MLQLFPVRNAPMTFTELQYLLRRRVGRLVGMLQLFPVRNAPMTFTELQYLLRRRVGRLVGSVAFAVALGFALPASDASALFIVNLPWVSPARKSQTTHAYMNLTSTDGATLQRLTPLRTRCGGGAGLAGQV